MPTYIARRGSSCTQQLFTDPTCLSRGSLSFLLAQLGPVNAPSLPYSCVLPQPGGEASSATTTTLLRGMSLHGCDPTAQHHPCWEGHLMPKGEKCCKTQGRHCSARLLPVCCASMAAHLGIPLKISRNTRSSTEDYCKEESQKVLAEQHPV